MDKKTKLNILVKCAHLFEINHITWQLGSSAMLYLRGFVDDFNDLDFLVCEEDYFKVEQLLEVIGQKVNKDLNPRYQTRHFSSFVIEGVSLDMMAGYAIMSGQQEHYFPMKKTDRFDYTYLDGQIIYLSTVDEWLRYYQLMERHDKVKIILNKKDYIHNEIILRKPTISDLQEIKAFRQEFIDLNESLHGGCGLSEYEDIKAWLDYIDLFLSKDTLPAGRVVSTSFISIRKKDQKMVGILHLRHELNEPLLLHGGHIGYSIRVSERGHRYAHEQLRLGLIECDLRGINPILITCNQDNEASRRTILHAHGVKENDYIEEDGNVVERYWIKR
ncbi:MAG TPA: hypothetical protein DHV05_04190 [Acholeplasmataceae bacterium]|nr:hypothetical protein [Acholeplasmataceae bacterium]HBO68464.1 hypothetical protein [Acholeplasmataceae bacterium]HBS00754.1 hypothetical protein [Acholeplasmataceae bacterium]HCZ24037.1 hypothetical protein [Acholeplasmataceae bacterium]